MRAASSATKMKAKLSISRRTSCDSMNKQCPKLVDMVTRSKALIKTPNTPISKNKLENPTEPRSEEAENPSTTFVSERKGAVDEKEGRGASYLNETDSDNEGDVTYVGTAKNDGEIYDDTDPSMNTQPLRPGDIIMYWNPFYRFGDARGRREAQVLWTRPDHRNGAVLNLSNGEILDHEHRICRIKRYHKGKLFDVPKPRYGHLIETYRMTNATLEVDQEDVSYSQKRKVGTFFDSINRELEAAAIDALRQEESSDDSSDENYAQKRKVGKFFADVNRESEAAAIDALHQEESSDESSHDRSTIKVYNVVRFKGKWKKNT